VEDVAGPPLLVDAAKEAVAQWLYQPTVMNGKPVATLTSITVHFHLNSSEAANPGQSALAGVIDSSGISVQPGSGFRHRTPVLHAAGSFAVGTVELEAALDANGEVSDVRALSGPVELRKPAIESVLQWHYLPETSSPVRISIQFDSRSDSTAETGAPREIGPVAGNQPAEDFTAGVLKSFQFAGVELAAQAQLRARIPFREGDVIHRSDIEKIQAAVLDFDQHLLVQTTGQMAGPDPHRDLVFRIRPVSAPATLLTQRN